jgi:hypothetical protein
MFRVSHRGEGIDDADTLEGARGIVRGQSPGESIGRGNPLRHGPTLHGDGPARSCDGGDDTACHTVPSTGQDSRRPVSTVPSVG